MHPNATSKVQNRGPPRWWCATSPQLDGKGGVYCEDCDIAVLTETEHVGVRPWAVDPAVAERLWEVSVALTGASL